MKQIILITMMLFVILQTANAQQVREYRYLYSVDGNGVKSKANFVLPKYIVFYNNHNTLVFTDQNGYKIEQMNALPLTTTSDRYTYHYIGKQNGMRVYRNTTTTTYYNPYGCSTSSSYDVYVYVSPDYKKIQEREYSWSKLWYVYEYVDHSRDNEVDVPDRMY